MNKEIKTVSFVNEQGYEYQTKKGEELSEQISEKIEKSRKNMRRKKLILTAGCIAFLSTGVVFGLVKANEYNNRPINMIIREAEIHAGKYTTGDGKFVDPHFDHNCVIGDKSLGTVEERIKNYAINNGYSEEQARKIVTEYSSLSDDNTNISNFEEEINNIAKK